MERLCERRTSSAVSRRSLITSLSNLTSSMPIRCTPTPTRIFHGGLSHWWEKDAQEYLAQRGFRDRQLCHGLHANGFADFKLSVNPNIKHDITSDCDERRHNLEKHLFEQYRICSNKWRAMETLTSALCVVTVSFATVQHAANIQQASTALTCFI